MKKTFASLLLLIAFAACKKSNDPAIELPPPTPTAVGTPDGAAVTKNIGTTGGTILSSDGMLELVIPAGAVATPTDITIQPITNHAPNGVGKGYRCLPDGLQFNTNITIRFRYSDTALSQTRKEFMRIAYQKPDRIWNDLEGVVNDTAAKTITTTTNHFTDYTIFNLFSLRPVWVHMRPGEQKSFVIEIARGLNLSTQINQQLQLLTDLNAHPVNWKVNGTTGGNAANGTISGNRFSANYTAPAAAPAVSPISVSAEINLSYTIDGVRYNRFILSADVYITGNQYKVQLEMERQLGIAGTWKMSDKGEYIAAITGSDVSVFGVQNFDPTLQLLQASPGCTSHSVTYTGVGDINIIAGDFQGGARAPNGLVQVLFNSSRQNQLPKFSFVCSGTAGTVDLGMGASFPGNAQFWDNGQIQVIENGTVGTTKIKFVITPL